MTADNLPWQPSEETPTKHPIGNNRGLQQAYDIRDFSANAALELRDVECTTLEDFVMRARAFKDYASTWYNASERIRLLRGRPLPGSLRPVAKPKGKSKTDHVSPMPEDSSAPKESP